MITARDGRFGELKRLEREWMGRDNGRTEDSGHSKELNDVIKAATKIHDLIIFAAYSPLTASDQKLNTALQELTRAVAIYRGKPLEEYP